jgi:hypothetical protein
MFYRLLRCIFFYDKPFLEVTWTDDKKTKKVIIYTSEFKRLKTMDDLFRFVEMPIYQKKYTIISEFRVIYPWQSIIIFNDMDIAVNNTKQFHFKMKPLYGNK